MSVHRHNQLHDKPYLQDDAFLGGVRFNILLSLRPIRTRTMFPAKRNCVPGGSFHEWTFCIGNSFLTTNYALPVSRGLIFSGDQSLTVLRPHIIYVLYLMDESSWKTALKCTSRCASRWHFFVRVWTNQISCTFAEPFKFVDLKILSFIFWHLTLYHIKIDGRKKLI